jgi:UDP-glucose 4-epimerase
VYGKTKLNGEQLVEMFARANSRRHVILRLFNVYGPGETSGHVIPDMVGQIKRRVPVTLGNQRSRRDFVFITDVVDAFQTAITSSVLFGTYNVGTGIAYSIANLIEIFKDLIAEEFEVSDQFTVDRKVDPPCLLADISKIRPYWKPTVCLRTGLRRILEKEAISHRV